MGKYQIDDNVPYPGRIWADEAHQKDEIFKIMDALEIGQSFIITELEERNHATYLKYKIQKRTNKQFRTKMCAHGAGSGFATRIWRVEDKDTDPNGNSNNSNK
jgi:uncharacterized protein (DUF2249 family)